MREMDLFLGISPFFLFITLQNRRFFDRRKYDLSPKSAHILCFLQKKTQYTVKNKKTPCFFLEVFYNRYDRIHM